MEAEKKATHTDAVDLIIEQWNRECPDLDVSPMSIIGRLQRCSALIRPKLDEAFSTFGMTGWEFDVLATLRRSGTPYTLTPSCLFSTLMVTSGTMTHRLQSLEAAGLIARVVNCNDARSTLVQLTDAGLELINRAVEVHVENEKKILSVMSSADLALLSESLVKLLAILEPEKD